jgi:hypothetical protein
MSVRERFVHSVEPFPELNKEGKLGVYMFVGGAAMLGTGLIKSGFEFNDLTTIGAGIEMWGFVIASHGRRRQLKSREIQKETE